jgi:hypothetical protein
MVVIYADMCFFSLTYISRVLMFSIPYFASTCFSEKGCVYRYSNSNQGGWSLNGQICSSVSGEGFGSSIGLFSTDMLIGSPSASGSSGVVNLYAQSLENYTMTLTAADVSLFGRSAVMLNLTAFVGAPQSASGLGKGLLRYINRWINPY